MSAPVTWMHLLRDAARRIDADDARALLRHAAGRDDAWLYAHGDDAVDAATAERFAGLLSRRAAGEPVAYLVGSRGFWTLQLETTPATLIPRPETELLVELALARIAPDAAARIADLGTGSGAIALALARERPQAQVLATDASAAALAVARRNAIANGIDNVRFAQGDWCAALAEDGYDLIASNPPYIAAGDPHLARGDLRFEPAAALASGADGLDALRSIARAAPAYLRDGGWLLVEHGRDQGDAVRALFAAAGLQEIATHRDLEQRDRVTAGRR